MERNVPTILKSLLQSSYLLNQQYVLQDFSTLNHKLQIQGGAELENGERPVLKYAVVGIGGLKFDVIPGTYDFNDSYIHRPTDTGLFRELPFVVRPANQDIDALTRLNYRLRKYIVIGNTGYYAYYGRLLDLGSNTPAVETSTIQPDGTRGTPSTFSPGLYDMFPTGTILAAGGNITATGNYISAKTTIPFDLTNNDVLELMNAASILFGNQNLSVISEIAFCSGVDRQITTTDAGGTLTYTEAIGVQVMNFMSSDFPGTGMGQGLRFTFDIGNTIPMLIPPQ